MRKMLPKQRSRATAPWVGFQTKGRTPVCLPTHGPQTTRSPCAYVQRHSTSTLLSLNRTTATLLGELVCTSLLFACSLRFLIYFTMAALDGASSISVAVRVRPFTLKEESQLRKCDDQTLFLGDGSLAAAPTLKFNQKGIRSVIKVVDEKCL